jgi:2'-5' RNA ligase
VTAGESARLFVALELPDLVRSELVRWRDAVAADPGLRMVPEQSLHVTLCFLGSLPAADAGAIGDAFAGALAGGAPVPLALGSVAWLPRRRPQVLAVAIDDPSGELATRQAALSGALAAGGWCRLESRPFFAHVTVARVRRGTRVRATELAGPEPVAFNASRVTLFRSRLGAGGARYEALRSRRYWRSGGASSSST